MTPRSKPTRIKRLANQALRLIQNPVLYRNANHNYLTLLNSKTK